MEYYGGAKVKEEGACGWSEDVDREFMRVSREAKDSLRETARRMAAGAGMTPASASHAISSAPAVSSAPAGHGSEVDTRNVNKHGGAHHTVAGAAVKTPKYSGKSDWEAFHAQFELLAQAEGWSMEAKALQLALCLTDDALSCLLLVSPEDRHNYEALVGALQRRFGHFVQLGPLRNELSNRGRRTGEPLRVLANDIESLTRRAYAHMPPSVQGELARDQFVRALFPTELRVQVQLQHPTTLQAALEMAAERENVWEMAAGDRQKESSPAVRAAVGSPTEEERPAWVSEVTELIRAVSLQTTRRPHPGPRVCWGCGQPGHLIRECPKPPKGQGNGLGSA